MNIKKTLKNAVTPKEYISEAPDSNRFGNTYRKIGPVSVLKSSATPDTKKKALEAIHAKEDAKKRKLYPANSGAKNAGQAARTMGLY